MATHVRAAFDGFANAWQKFFFSEVRLDSLALIRILLCGVLLIPIAGRWPHAREFYSADGVVTQFVDGFPVGWDLPVLNGPATVALYSAFVFFLIAGMIGWHTRMSLAIAAVLTLYFGFLDLVGTLTKYTIIATHILAILAFARSGAAWSVDALLGREPGNGRGAIWPIRVIQIFLAILYFSTAITKVKSPEFMTGEHTVFWMQTSMHFAHPMGYWMSTHPQWVVVANFVVVLWETLFCVLCWNRRALLPLLGLGVVFHLATYTLLGLAIFPLITLALYPAFVSPERSRAVLMSLRNVLSRLPRFSTVRLTNYSWAFPFMLGVVIVTGVEAEYQLDPLGQRSPKPALPVIPHQVAQERLSETGPTSPSEWVYRVDVGDSSVAGVVCGDSHGFKADSTALLQLWLHTPHPDMYVYVDVHDSTDIAVMQDGIAITRGSSRHTVPFAFANNLRPGQYTFVFHDDLGLIASHPFTIVE